MKFMLKDGLIHIVENHGLPNNSIEGSVEAPGLDGFALSYSINGGKFKKLDNKIVIPKEEAKKTELSLIVKGVKENEIVFFKSDTIPLTHAVVLGKSLEDSYPEVIKLLLKRMEKLEEHLGLELKETKEGLHKNMLDLVTTFEEIIRKGSLF